MTATRHTLARLWQGLDLPPQALDRLTLVGGEAPLLPSSFAVATAAQASLAAAALAASELAPQHRAVQVDRVAAAQACSSHFLIDGMAPPMWDPLSGLYPCGADADQPGWVRLHANFAHHRDRALAVLGLPQGPHTPREVLTQALRRWPAEVVETAVATAGGVASALRSFEEWDAGPAARAVAAEPLVALTRIGDAPPRRWHGGGPTPLHGLRVLDLTRILAGPVAARLLADWGAEVLMLNGPRLPNIAAIADLSRGKRSALLDLDDPAGVAQLRALAAAGHVFLQAYRPGALAARGLGPEALAAVAPGIVCVSLAAWGHSGPWAGRRGFDSLVQTATGFNVAEAAAAGLGTPMALPVQILDHAAGHLLAFGALAALRRQALEGGSWLVQVSLARTGLWLRSLGQDAAGLATVAPAPVLEVEDSGFGRLSSQPPAVAFDGRLLRGSQPAMPPGSHPAAWVGPGLQATVTATA
ncbi:MAG: CoA transferase [Rubrivivax sp.]|nr:CoA transferase [Rubrivivax sp.]